MSNVVPMKISAPEPLVSYGASQLKLIKTTIAKDLNDPEFDMFIAVCRRVGLDPFRKQIYANVYSKKSADKRSVVFITSVDGFRAIAARSGDYRPDENEAELIYDKDLIGPENPKGIEKAVVTMWKRDQSGTWNAIRAAARWEEFAPISEEFETYDTGETWPDGNPKKGKKPTGRSALDADAKFWRKMPAHMLAKCAEVQALRKGWPEDLSGIYAPEEMAQADLEEKSAAEIIAEEETNRRLMLLGGRDAIHFVMKAGDPIESIPLGKVADRCIEYINAAEHPLEVEKWRERNRVSLQEFWARQPSDALEVKKALEAKLKAIAESAA